MKRFTFRSGEAAAAETLTPESFLAKYFGGTEVFSNMTTELDEFAPKLRSNLESCIDFTNRGYKVNSVIEKREHKTTNMPYVYMTMSMRNGDVPLMLLNEGNIAEFLQDYQAGKVIVGFNYQELQSFINK